MNKKNIIRVLISAAVVAVLMSAFAFPAYAGGNYVVNSADFYVELQPNGDARIVEKWNLDYNGSFHRFRHGYWTSPPTVQKFGTIKALQYKIDGEVVPMEKGEIDLTGRILSDNGEKQLCWYKLIEGTDSAVYEADYLLTNVVKKCGDETVFSCRFIGQNFDPEIESLNIYLKLVPGMELDNVRSSDSSTVELKQNDVCYSVSEDYSQGLYGLTYIFKQDGSTPYFTGNLTEVTESDIRKAFKKSSSNTLNRFAQENVAAVSYVTIFVFVILVSKLGKRSGSYRHSGSGSGCGDDGCGGGCGSSCGGGCGSSCGGGCGGGGAD